MLMGLRGASIFITVGQPATLPVYQLRHMRRNIDKTYEHMYITVHCKLKLAVATVSEKFFFRNKS
jgi:hypothetical protein